MSDSPHPLAGHRYAGIDWGAFRHAVCVIDASGQLLTRFELEHDGAGLTDLRRRLARFGPPRDLPIAVERPSGLLVDTLVEAGHPIVPIHPNVVRHTRSRYGAAGAKSDAGDAFMLADMLRTDGHRFAPLRPTSDAVRALRALTRTRDDLIAERVRQVNQLGANLDTFWPGAKTLFAALHSPIALAFLTRYPGPAKAARLGEKTMARFLRAQRYSGRRTAAELVERLRAAPVGCVGALEAQAREHLVAGQVVLLTTLTDRIRQLEARIDAALETIELGTVMASFPRAGRVNAAQIVAELGEDPERFGTEARLAAEAGVAPVTRASGKARAVVCRFACNKRLRRALTCWADNSRHGSAWARAVYQRARASGKTHPHAVRVLARSWLRVLWRCWQSGTAYDPTRHGGAAAVPEPA